MGAINFMCKNIFYTRWYDRTNFYRDNWSLARASRAVVTNNSTVIIEAMRIEVVLIEMFLYIIRVNNYKINNCDSSQEVVDRLLL